MTTRSFTGHMNYPETLYTHFHGWFTSMLMNYMMYCPNKCARMVDHICAMFIAHRHIISQWKISIPIVHGWSTFRADIQLWLILKSQYMHLWLLCKYNNMSHYHLLWYYLNTPDPTTTHTHPQINHNPPPPTHTHTHNNARGDGQKTKTPKLYIIWPLWGEFTGHCTKGQ